MSHDFEPTDAGEATAELAHTVSAHGHEQAIAGRKTWLDRAIEYTTAIVLLADAVAVGLQVASRLLMNSPIAWTEEIARVLMIWVMLFGGVVALRRGQHTRITAVIRMLRSETSTAVELGVNLVVFAFFAVLAYQAYALTLLSMKELLPASEISGAFVSAPMPICIVLMMWYLLQEMYAEAQQVFRSSRALAVAAGCALAAFGSVVIPLLAGVTPVAVLVIGFLVTGALGMPIGFALALVSFTYLLSLERVPLTILPIKMIGGVDSFPLLAIPLFILGGALMETGGISQRIVDFAKAMVGHLRGGLPMGTIVAEMLFSGISGSTTADVSAMSSLMVPSMKRAGYPGEDAVSIVSAASALGMLVPPCLTMVVLGSLANLSIVTLFIAGFVPAFVLAIWVALVVYLRARRFGWPLERRATFKEFLRVTWAAGVPMGMPIIIFGGIFTGWVTVTEAALIAVIYALVVGVLIYHEIPWAQLPEMFVSSGVVTAMTLWVLGAASVFAWILAREQVPQFVASWFISGGRGWVFFMAMTLAIFVVVGALLEGLPVLLIFGPIFIPIAIDLGIDPIHYGTVIVACMGIAFFLPPVGVGLYIACGIGKVDLNRTIPVYVPYLLALIVGLVIVAYVPEFTLVLPRWILGYVVK
jgi:tripartite ATP-independent transporter DctM subunit